MTLKKELKRYLGRKATKRLYKAMPWLNGAVALAVVASMLRGKELGEFLQDVPELVSGSKRPRVKGRHRSASSGDSVTTALDRARTTVAG